jgi:hypothetical protein
MLFNTNVGHYLGRKPMNEVEDLLAAARDLFMAEQFAVRARQARANAISQHEKRRVRGLAPVSDALRLAGVKANENKTLAARGRLEKLRPIFQELATLTSQELADALNRRPDGPAPLISKTWSAEHVQNIRQKLGMRCARPKKERACAQVRERKEALALIFASGVDMTHAQMAAFLNASGVAKLYRGIWNEKSVYYHRRVLREKGALKCSRP